MLIPSLGSAQPLPRAPHCPIFPANNPWNERVDRLPVAADSAKLIAGIGLGAPVHPDFGSGTYGGGPIGIRFAVVSDRTRRVPVSFDYAGESDKGPYPDDALHQLDRLTGRDFEVVNTASLPHPGR